MNRIAVVSLIGLMGAAATAIVPAGASTGGHIRALGQHSLVRPDQPNSNIVGAGATAKFVPKKITAGEDTSGNDCSTGYVSLTVTNTGTATAFVYYGGEPFFKLKKGNEEELCAYGFGAGAKLSINLGSKSGTQYSGKLKITFSD